MKVVGINGSHRKGNTDFLLDTVLGDLQSKGHSTLHIKLRQKNIQMVNEEDYEHPYTDHGSSCRDDMKEIIQALIPADVIILGSPTMFYNVSARMKGFMDRCNPFWFTKELNGKSFFCIGVGGSGPISIGQMLKKLIKFGECLGMTVLGSQVFQAQKPEEVGEKEEYLKEMHTIAQKISQIKTQGNKKE